VGFSSPQGQSLIPFKCVSLNMRYRFCGDIAPVSNTLSFPSLSDIELHTTSLREAITFLRAADHIQELFSIISSYTRFKLKSVVLDGLCDDGDEGENEDECTITLDMFQPLLRCSYLKIVNIDLFLITSLDDDDIRMMARAWPHLELLKINEDQDFGETPRITLSGIRDLLDACPSLKTLALTIHVDSADRGSPEWQLDRLDSPEGIRSGMSLTSFNLVDSQIEDHVFFFVTISQIALNVRDFGEGWMEVVGSGVSEVQIMCREKKGLISAWTWEELDERLGPLAE